MTEVSVKGNLDGAIKRFKVKCSRDGVLSDVKKRKYYSKPGVVRREEKKQNTINSRKRNKRTRRES
jgi:small subunit ribosomal protein S21